MTMTLADTTRIDDGVMTPRADRPKRRTFTAEYKLRIVAEYDAAEHGARGAILRREGLYSSHIIEWRKAAQAGAVGALGPRTAERRDREIEQLKARAERAEAELARTRAALDIVGKHTRSWRRSPRAPARASRRRGGPAAGSGFSSTSCSTSSPATSWPGPSRTGEDSQIAMTMLEDAMGVHGVPEAVHADRGTSMTSKPVAQLLLDLGVDRSHSRPRVSNDNPFSEAAFKTLKYAPAFPDSFGSLAAPKLPKAAWINQPSPEALIQTA